MVNVRQTLEEALKIDGAIAAAIANWDAGLCLATAGGGPRLNIGAVAAGHGLVLKARMAAVAAGVARAVQELLITLEDQVHLVRPLRRRERLFVCLAIDKATGNLGIARHRLQGLASGLDM
jgi:hypothetical protein